MPKGSNMKHLATAITVLFFAMIARGSAEDLECPHCAAMELGQLATMLADDVLRDMVCRVSSEHFSPARLSSALNLPEGQVMRRINTLRGWGLIRSVRRDSAYVIVEPIPGEGARTLRRWAAKYCAVGGTCGGTQAVSKDQFEEKNTYASGQVMGSSRITELRGKLITVFGGSGFIGRHLVQQLVKAGARVRVASRNPDASNSLKPSTGHGYVELMAVNVHDDALVRDAVSGADMVVNLSGILNESGLQRFYQVHAEGGHIVADAVNRADISRFVHVSAASADMDSPSLYARTKATGEQYARVNFPQVTIVRPTVVFGPGDQFFSHIDSFSQYSPIMPLFGGGKVRFQPVYVGDVSAAIVRILEDPSTSGRTYELGGPRIMTSREVFSLVLRHTGRHRPFVSLPFWVAHANAEILQRFPNPLLTRDHVKLMQGGDVADPEALGFADLGITPTPVEEVLPKYLGRDRRDVDFEVAY